MEIVLRAAAIFLFVWILTRAMGKRELVQMTAFELVLLVSIGDLMQQAVTQEDMSVTGAVLAIGTIGLLSLFFSWVSFRFKASRTVLDGMPVVVVRNGQVDMAALKIERMSEEELRETARNQGIDDLGTVRLAIVEPDGRLSFLQDDPETESGPPDEEQPVG